MALKAGYSPETIGKNIAMEVKRGTTHEQAIAIALNMARREYRKAHPVGQFPHHLKGAGKFYSENPISEKTAHKLRKAAPRTFMKMTDEEIKRSIKVKSKKKRISKNPVRPLKKKTDWYVDFKQGNNWQPLAAFKDKSKAIEYAKAFSNARNKQTKVYLG